MTPEQLEAHRVRFEQHYSDPSYLKSERRGSEYASLFDTRCWQAYQWALADADRAQRAAPGVQGGEPMPYLADRLKDHTCTKVENAGGTPGFTLYKTKLGRHPEYQLYLDEAYALWSNLGDALGVIQPPQQSAQPGGEAVKLVDALLLEAEIFWWNDGPEGKSSDAMKAARDQVIVALSAAAQPVEVQQVRDAIDVYHAELDDRLHAGHSMGRAIDAIEQALGMPWIQGASLKPTSSEGG